MDREHHRQLFEILPLSGNTILSTTVTIRNVGRTNEGCSQFVHLNQTGETCAQLDDTTMSSQANSLGSKWVLQDSGEPNIVYIAAQVRPQWVC